MKDREIPLVHIGLHKTATTWLQNVLFDDSEAGLTSPWSRPDILRWFVLVNPLRFDADAVRSQIQEGLRRCGSGVVPVLSHERLSGNPHSGGYDRKSIADRLADVLPEARVLIVIREQRAMIASVFKQYVREGGGCSLRRYLSPPHQGAARVPLFSLDYFEYHDLIEYYMRLFGDERVLVLPYELLRENAGEFLSGIARFTGTRAPSQTAQERQNVALSALSAAIKRWLNLPLVRDGLNPAGWIEAPRFNIALGRFFEAFDRHLPRWVREAAERRLRRTIEMEVGGRFRESNRKTSELIGLELTDLGYAG